MTIIVIIFAALVIAFAGGCLVLGGAQVGGLALVLLLLLGLNVAAIWAIRSPSRGGAIFLMLFGLADIGLAAFLVTMQRDRYVGDIVPFVAFLILFKGLAEMIVGYRQLRHDPAA